MKSDARRALRAGRALYPKSWVVRQGSQMEQHALPYFVEDRTQQSASYTDYLMALQKAVMSPK